MLTNFRIHIDHIDNYKKDIWAVYTYANNKYYTIPSTKLKIIGISLIPVGPKDMQPRAYLYGYGNVIKRRDGSIVIIGGK